jgi:L-amino acid N-acyltransferase YncA
MNNLNKKNLTIRFAELSDLQAITTIYNTAIRAGNVTAHITELTAEDRKEWFYEHSPNDYPIYILETSHGIVGWGSLSVYRKGRMAFRETAEITNYIDYSFHGKGFGKILHEHMMADCVRLGIKNLIAYLLDINPRSIAMLEKYGFEKWGHLPNIVNLKGQKCGHLIYGKNLIE